MNILEASGLVKDYGDVRAVRGVDFALEEGDILGFLGPNGAGKTTTINMLTGLARITAGSVRFMGEDYTGNSKRVQGVVGVVPDESNLYDELDGFENLCFCASLYGLRWRERRHRARLLLQQFGLTDAGNRRFKAYSKGMKRKLCIAAGIIHQPRILFLDEPTTGIDVASARQVRKLIIDLNRAGTTIFLTTHYIEEAERLCNRIAFIVQGQIVRTGTVDELMQEATNVVTVEFRLAAGAADVVEDCRTGFPGLAINAVDDTRLRIQSAAAISLSPLMRFFDDRCLDVYEARIVRPALEDVFVKITGIEPQAMKKEREGGKR